MICYRRNITCYCINDTHREKLCFTQFSTKNGSGPASALFQIIIQSIKLYTFHYHVLRVQLRLFICCKTKLKKKIVLKKYLFFTKYTLFAEKNAFTWKKSFTMKNFFTEKNFFYREKYK